MNRLVTLVLIFITFFLLYTAIVMDAYRRQAEHRAKRAELETEELRDRLWWFQVTECGEKVIGNGSTPK